VIVVKGNLASEQISIFKVDATRDIQKCMKNGIESIGGLSLSADSVVIIKPNLCCIKPPETGATTDVKVVEGLINYLKEGFDVSDMTIVESDGTQVLADVAFKLLGYEKLSKKLGVRLVNLSNCPSSVKQFPENVFLKEIQVPDVFGKADFFISMPKIKTHIDCLFTCALKNQFGCNPYPRKVKYHKRLDDAIVDLNVVFKPDLVVVDGIVAMEGFRGPTDGLPIKMNTLIFGRDSVAVDYLVARVMGLNPDHMKYLKEAVRRGIGKPKYEIVGLGPEEITRRFRTDRPRLKNFYGFFCKY
jgi:uncharacterized protein (DUF362 family)